MSDLEGPVRLASLSEYERAALKQIHEWKNPELGWFGQTMKQIGWPRPIDHLTTLLNNAGDAITQNALLDVINKALAGTVRVLGDAASWSVSPKARYSEYRKAEHDVHRRTDIFRLDLEDVDGIIGWLDAKYTGLAFAQGATTGAAGLPGLILDVPALVALNLRAIAEYATYYGFDVSLQRERLFAMQVLGLASSTDIAIKQTTMVQLARLAEDAARKKTWKTIEESALLVVIQRIAKALGIRLTKAKLAQAAPILGAAVGGGFNAYYTARVCDAASHLYRERFLAEKYGPDVIDVSAATAGAEDFESTYPEAFEELPEEPRRKDDPDDGGSSG